MQDGELVGIIGREDVWRGIPASCDENTRKMAASSKVQAYMTQHPITANPMDPLEDIALEMRRNKIGAMPVLEDGRVIVFFGPWPRSWVPAETGPVWS